jgi:predicted phosphoribosyltransferase
MRPPYFRDRREAGRLLAEELRKYANDPKVIVLALPRGGVPVGYEVAHALGTPLDIFLVRKLGVPGYEEFAMGAVASGGVRVLNDEVVHVLHIPSYVVDAVTAWERQELARPARIVMAAPTAPPDTCQEMRAQADDVVCAITPEPFYSVGLWYENFTQTTDEEVRELLALSVSELAAR